MANLYQILTQRFADRPARASQVAIRTADGREISFGEMDETIARYAGFIRALAIVPGDRVAVQVEKSPEALFLYLACLKTGVVYLPLNSAYAEGEIDYFLGDAEPALVVHQAKSSAWMAALCTKHGIAHRYVLEDDRAQREKVEVEYSSASWSKSAANAAPMNEIVDRADDDLAAILYTSGTTGRSKGAMLTHRNLASNAITLHREWGFRDGDVLLHALPLFHVHGLFVACHTALINGSTMLFHAKFDAAAAVRDLPRATVFMGVPTMYVRLLGESSFDANASASIRLFVSGSAPLLAETFHSFRERTGQVILERYGMTETGMITSNPLVGERKAGTVGKPLPDVEVRIANDAGDECAAGEVGHLLVRGPNVLPGYWRRPDKNAEEWTADGFFKTGDIGVCDADGYIAIVGRSKDLIISGGYNVYPKEIELLLDEMPGVAESAVVGIAHPDFGEAVVAVLVKSAGASPNEAELIAAMKSKLANFKVPKRVFVVDALPRNAMGKVQKNELRKTYAGLFGVSSA